MLRTENALVQMDAARKQMREISERIIRAAVVICGAENVSVVHDSIEVRIPKKGVVR